MLLRAVLDTNVLLAARRSVHPTSPNREILKRWQRAEFILLYSEDTLLEYAEKLLELGVSEVDIEQFLRRVQFLGEHVDIEFYHLKQYPPDADDVAFLLCALNGNASHLVTYDKGLLEFRSPSFLTICEPLVFLGTLRSH